MRRLRELVPGGFARGVRMDRGQTVAVVNVDGGQVGDMFGVCLDDPTERLSAAHTRGEHWSLFPKVGETFVTNLRRPVFTLLEDSTPGGHDMLVPACDPVRYQRLGAPPTHRSCAGNFAEVSRDLGFDADTVPQPVNLFMPVGIGRDGSLRLHESAAKAGDRVVLRAERDVFLIVSACPQDLVPLNTGGVSNLLIEIAA